MRTHLHSIVAILVTLFVASAHAADWPCFRGPNRNGVIDANFELLPGGAKKLWEAQVGGGSGSMAVVKGRIYVLGGGRDDNLMCLDERTGKKVWGQKIDTWDGNSTPSVDGDRVYVMASMDPPSVYACDAATGKVLWTRKLPKPTGDRQYGHAGSPLVWEDLVIVNAGGGAAVKKADGEFAWVHEGFPGLATPVVFKGPQGRAGVALFGGDKLIARDARTGKELYAVPWKTDLAVNACDPIVMDDKVFLCSNYGRGRALYDVRAAQPKSLWEFRQGMGSSFSSGFVRDGLIHCFAQRHFACLDTATGEPRWEVDGGTSALLVGDKLIVVRENGEITFTRLAAGGPQKLSKIDSGLNPIKGVPAYSDGKLYLRNENGKIFCLQIGTAR